MQVRLSIIGRVGVWRAGRRFDASEVGSRKARTLLGRLAVERRRIVPVDLVAAAEAQLTRAPRLIVFAARRAIDLLARAPVLAEEPGSTWVERARMAQTELLLRAQRAIADARAAV